MLDKKITKKKFLRIAVLTLVVVATGGISSFINSLLNKNSNQNIKTAAKTSGYGNSRYGM